MFGADHFPGQFISDSLYLFLLNGYGLVGVMAYLSLLWMSSQLSGHRSKVVVTTFIFVAGIPFNLWEYFPQNAILMFLWGLVAGTSRKLLPLHAPVRAARDVEAASLAQSGER
jgi:hypothetical protein